MPKQSDPRVAQFAAAFADRLRHAMSERGVSRKKLEQLTGLGTGHVSRIASGKRTALPETIQLLADALHVDPGWLAFGVHQMDYTLPGDVVWPGVCKEAQAAIQFARHLGATDDDISRGLEMIAPQLHSDSRMVFSSIMHVANGTVVASNTVTMPPPEDEHAALLPVTRSKVQRAAKSRHQ